jgi:5,10-methylenetetrahydromethanopterin reductase
MLQVAARVGDGVIIAPYATAPGIAYALSLVERALEESGRDRRSLQVALRVDLAVARDRSRAAEAARYWVALPLWVSYSDWSYLKPLPHLAVPEAARTLIARRDYSLLPEVARRLPDEFVSELALAGTPDEVGERLRAIGRLGVDQLIIHPVPTADFDLEETVRYFAAEVRRLAKEEAP